MTATGSAPVITGSPPAQSPAKSVVDGESFLVILAREIAMDIHPLDEILKTRAVDAQRWDEIQAMPRFQALLRSNIEEWNSALNTEERVKLKALVMVEEAMPEYFERMHDPKENLPAKVKALEVFGNIAGLTGRKDYGAGQSGERFSVTINMGADSQLQKSAPIIDVTPNVVSPQLDK